MKKVDLNIKLSKPAKDEKGAIRKPCEVAIQWIGIMLGRAINKPDPKTGNPTVVSNMEVQRKYFRVMNTLDAHKKGIVEIEDDDFNFLDRNFHQAEMAVQRDIAEVLVAIEDALNEAKIEKEE